jgi:hypothetical protein
LSIKAVIVKVAVCAVLTCVCTAACLIALT